MYRIVNIYFNILYTTLIYDALFKALFMYVVNIYSRLTFRFRYMYMYISLQNKREVNTL